MPARCHLACAAQPALMVVGIELVAFGAHLAVGLVYRLPPVSADPMLVASLVPGSRSWVWVLY